MKMHRILPVTFLLIFFLGISTFCFSQDKEAVFFGHTVPTDDNMMFYIQKNTNPNTIVYASKLSSDGKINPKEPIEVFWRRYQEDGRRKKLGWLEKTFAFDFKVKPVKEKDNTYIFSLVAMKKRDLYLTQNKKGSPLVIMKIAGKTARLERIYLMVDDSKRIQSVLSMELFGRDPKTGKLVYEKIIK